MLNGINKYSDPSAIFVSLPVWRKISGLPSHKNSPNIPQAMFTKNALLRFQNSHSFGFWFLYYAKFISQGRGSPTGHRLFPSWPFWILFIGPFIVICYNSSINCYNMYFWCAEASKLALALLPLKNAPNYFYCNRRKTKKAQNILMLTSHLGLHRLMYEDLKRLTRKVMWSTCDLICGYRKHVWQNKKQFSRGGRGKLSQG